MTVTRSSDVTRITFLPPAALAALMTLALSGTETLSDALALRVHGAGAGAEATFTVDSLAELGAVAVVTETTWTEDREVTFVGVPLERVLAAVDATGDNVRAVALNDYEAFFSARDVIEMDAIIAYEMDGSRIPVRDKGPFWIVFPWSERPELRTAEIQSYSVWQLSELEIQ